MARASWVAGAAAIAFAGIASAQPYPFPPPAAPPRPLTIAAPVEQSLANGLRVITARRDDVPLVSVLLVVLSGSEADPPALSGLASMTAGLLTQGTTRHTAPQLAAAAEALGGSLDSSAGWGQSTVSITVTTPKLDAALGLVAEVAREPVFAQEEIDRLRAQMLDGLKVSYANPSRIATLAAVRLAYGASAWGHPAGGTPTSLPRIVRADLVAAHAVAFRPDRAVLILSGDIDPSTALSLARARFGSWQAPATSPAPVPVVPAAAAPGPALTVIDMPSASQAGVTMTLPLPPRRDNEWATGAVLNAVLGGGYSSRLNQEIRIKRGLSYGADSYISGRERSGLFVASVQTKNETAAQVVGLAQAEIDTMAAAPVGAAELAARKAMIVGGFSRSVETTAGLASAIDGLVVSGRSPALLTTQIDSIEKVDADAVQRYAAAHLGVAGRRVVVAGVADRIVGELSSGGAPVDVIRADQLDLDRVDLKRPATAR
ncbi:MAG TPA: pitrilysin family protein [Caldimonas sp.]|nr:pitrilysin family protein [Caldimonas sp.]